MAKDYYEILGVGKDATQDQIKAAYRNLAMKYHPDKNKDKGAEEKFKEINESYAVLGDPEKRKQYDTYGPQGFGQRFTQDDIFRGFNMEDVLRDLQSFGFSFGGDTFGGGNPFGEMFSQQQEQTGVNVYVSFEDMERGLDKEFEIKRYKTCENCSGSGGEPGSKQIKCSTCGGTGRNRIHQNTPFGMIDVVATCNKCGGRGKTFEKTCSVCKGKGRNLVKEKFRITAERSDKENKDGKDKKAKRWFGFF